MATRKRTARYAPSRRGRRSRNGIKDDSGVSSSEPTKEGLFRYLQKAEQRTANLRRILDDFEATPGARKQIKDILNQLVKEGKVSQHKGNRYEAPARDLIEGSIILHRD